MKQILIIEDDLTIAKTLKLALELSEFKVMVATDAISGKSMILHEEPDLIILDISVPAGNGWELIEFITNNPKVFTTPVIIMTAHASPEVKLKAENLGVLAYLEKPFDLNGFLEIIKEELVGLPLAL